MIAIKDRKMPVNCEECFARVLAWCRLDEEERIVVPAVPWELEDRPEWCPLIDVPDMNVGNCSEIPNNSDCVSRWAAVEAIANQSRFSAEEIINICDKSVQDENGWLGGLKEAILAVLELPFAQPERLTDDDFETIRIHLSAYKERLCNQRRWKEAEEYQRIINRFMSFASAQPEIIRCKECVYADENYHCDYMTTWNDGDCFCCYGKRGTDGRFDKQTGGD